MLPLASLIFCNTLLFAASFMVTVPSKPVMVIRGETAFLPCEFTSGSNPILLVITWQRMEDVRVVHSYYYQSDQLDRQSSDYTNRTKLDHKQIAKGNATLRITNFGLKDKGDYLCVVANGLETDRGVVRLEYAAYYSEPRLSIHRSFTNTTVQYETEGYPRPEVMWHSSDGQNLTDEREISSVLEGLYYLRSSYVTQNPAFNITFSLKNPAVYQELHRHVALSYDENTGKSKSTNDKSTVVLSILCAVLACCSVVLLGLFCHNKRNNSCKQQYKGKAHMCRNGNIELQM